MSDESQLQVIQKGDGASLILSTGRSSLIARGRRDAEILAQVAKAVMSGVTCEMCGEHKELDDVDDDFCCWCRSRETEISEIWNGWDFDRWGRPLNGVWDDEAQRRDVRAKFEIDTHLKQLGLHARWIEMWWGFGGNGYIPIRRGQAQAFWVADAVNQKWGFDGEGDPVGEAWGHEAQRRAAFAVDELKKILADLGLPLPDDWPNEWSPNASYMLNSLEISEGVWPLGFRGDQRLACSQCGEHKELIYAGSVCAKCADALS